MSTAIGLTKLRSCKITADKVRSLRRSKHVPAGAQPFAGMDSGSFLLGGTCSCVELSGATGNALKAERKPLDARSVGTGGSTTIAGPAPAFAAQRKSTEIKSRRTAGT